MKFSLFIEPCNSHFVLTRIIQQRKEFSAELFFISFLNYLAIEFLRNNFRFTKMLNIFDVYSLNVSSVEHIGDDAQAAHCV